MAEQAKNAAENANQEKHSGSGTGEAQKQAGNGSEMGGNPGENLGEGGLKALHSERERATQAEKSLKAFTELGLTPEQIVELQQKGATPSQEDILAAAKKQAEQMTSATLAANARTSEIRVQAVQAGFHNPDDALRFLPADKISAIAVTNGAADAAAVKSLLDELAKSHSYLVKPASASASDVGIGRSGAGGVATAEPGRSRIRAAYSNSK